MRKSGISPGKKPVYTTFTQFCSIHNIQRTCLPNIFCAPPNQVTVDVLGFFDDPPNYSAVEETTDISSYALWRSAANIAYEEGNVGQSETNLRRHRIGHWKIAKVVLVKRAPVGIPAPVVVVSLLRIYVAMGSTLRAAPESIHFFGGGCRTDARTHARTSNFRRSRHLRLFTKPFPGILLLNPFQGFFSLEWRSCAV